MSLFLGLAFSVKMSIYYIFPNRLQPFSKQEKANFAAFSTQDFGAHKTDKKHVLKPYISLTWYRLHMYRKTSRRRSTFSPTKVHDCEEKKCCRTLFLASKSTGKMPTKPTTLNDVTNVDHRAQYILNNCRKITWRHLFLSPSDFSCKNSEIAEAQNIIFLFVTAWQSIW